MERVYNNAVAGGLGSKEDLRELLARDQAQAAALTALAGLVAEAESVTMVHVADGTSDIDHAAVIRIVTALRAGFDPSAPHGGAEPA